MIKEVCTIDDFYFDYVEPGDFYIRTIIDINKDSVWNEGSFTERKQYEKRYFYYQAISVKSNWDISDLKIDSATIRNF